MKNLLNLRIPSIFAIVLLFLGLGLTLYISKAPLPFISRASQDTIPNDLRVSNITDSQVTISYSTDTPVIGSVAYSNTEALDLIAYDDRDPQDQLGNYKTHHITLKNLTADTTYNFVINSGPQTYKDNEKNFVIKTASKVSNDSNDQYSVSGSVIPDDTNKTDGYLVYLTSDNAQTLSTITDANGNFNFNFKGLLNNDLTSLVNLSTDTIFEIKVISDINTDVAFKLDNFKAILPPLIFGQNYDFTISDEPVDNKTTDNKSFPVLPVEPAEVGSVSIDSPNSEERLSDNQPLFEGSAVPGEEVDILIQSDQEINTKVITDSKGGWSYRPDDSLEPGEHTITITTRDLSGVLRTVSRKFVVLAEGSQFTDPSVAPSPRVETGTPTPPIEATAAPTEEPTPTEVVPTEEPTPTTEIIEEISPTVFPTAIITEAVDERPKDLNTGTTENLMTIVSVILFISGGILLYLSRSRTI